MNMKIKLRELIKEGSAVYSRLEHYLHPPSSASARPYWATGFPAKERLDFYEQWLEKVYTYGRKEKLELPFALFNKEMLDSLYNENAHSSENLGKLVAKAFKQVAYIEKIAAPHQSENSTHLYVLTLSKDGRLTSKMDSGKEYAMDTTGFRFRFLKQLATRSQKHFTPTREWARICDVTDDQIRKTAGDIKRIVADRFTELKGQMFIDGKGRSGYRLGSLMKIDVL
jgi:hypothetical protein